MWSNCTGFAGVCKMEGGTSGCFIWDTNQARAKTTVIRQEPWRVIDWQPVSARSQIKQPDMPKWWDRETVIYSLNEIKELPPADIAEDLIFINSEHRTWSVSAGGSCFVKCTQTYLYTLSTTVKFLIRYAHKNFLAGLASRRGGLKPLLTSLRLIVDKVYL